MGVSSSHAAGYTLPPAAVIVSTSLLLHTIGRFVYLLACRSALCVQVYLKMDRADKAEQQVKVRQLLGT